MQGEVSSCSLSLSLDLSQKKMDILWGVPTASTAASLTNLSQGPRLEYLMLFPNTSTAGSPFESAKDRPGPNKKIYKSTSGKTSSFLLSIHMLEVSALSHQIQTQSGLTSN